MKNKGLADSSLEELYANKNISHYHYCTQHSDFALCRVFHLQTSHRHLGGQ